jgi:RNA polymerase sigma factor (TIGR02999 family)
VNGSALFPRAESIVSETGEITTLLVRWRGGDEAALERLMPLVYDELRRLAERYMRAERPDHTLQATALVHEAYVRLVGVEAAWQDRVHFLSLAARLMRRILVDHAKAARRGKRGGGAVKMSLDDVALVAPEPSSALLDLDEALNGLAALDERKARAVELHYFGGLTYDETAEVLGVSAATVDRDLRMARAWLYREVRND